MENDLEEEIALEDNALETVSESIYDHPKYYDLVFGADCAAEVKFILGCTEQHSAGSVAKKQIPNQRLFEPACGTGRLLNAFARRGFAVSGLDLNPQAIDFCNARFERRGLPTTAFVADMSDFKLKKKIDVAFNTINSFRHLSSEASARKHLQCMAQSTCIGGIYLLGIHLTPTEAPASETESWSARRGHLTVNTHMWTVDRNPKTRVERFGIRFDVHTPTRQFRINDMLVLRSYTAPQMKRLIRSAGGWEIVQTYDFGYDLEDPIDVDATTEDVVYVLRRVTQHDS